jgi:cation:H+ antiporter
LPVQFVLGAAGLIVLTVAADHLVVGSSQLAARFRVSPVVVGIVVIGLGTSAPEFMVSGVAAVRGDAGIAVGNLVGSNILNLTLILGVSALIGTVHVASTVIRREIPLAVAGVAMFAVVATVGLNPVSGAVLAVSMVGALALLVRWTRQGRNQELASEVEEFTGSPHRPAVAVSALRAIAGLAGVLVGAQLLVANASAIAERLGVPQVVIGFTLIALGTSLPELVTAVQAQRRGESDLVVGNLFGSNLFNSLAGGAVVGFAMGTGESASAAGPLIAAMVVTALLAWAILRRGYKVTRPEGTVLLCAYALTMPLLLAA